MTTTPTLLAILAAALLVLPPLLYTWAASAARARLPSLHNRHVVLLIAHPDDEAMFFAPSVLALTRPAANNHVRILCLSTGDADGLGATRRRELQRSAVLLGLRSEEDVVVVDSPDFPDSMTQTWDATKISDLLSRTFAPPPPPPPPPSLSSSTTSSISTRSKSKQQKEEEESTATTTPTIDTLITFDAGGVSSHPNHISLYHGARAFVGAGAAAAPAPAPAPVDLYTLTSVPVWRKYSGFLDTLATLVSVLLFGDDSQQGQQGASPSALVSMSSLYSSSGSGSGSGAGGREESYGAARRAMTDAHRSQMVWFRWGWIALSRYMYINDLRLERVD